MTIKELANKLNITYKGDGNREVHGIKDMIVKIENVSKNHIYFVETMKVLKKHPEILENDGIIFTIEKLADNFQTALIANEENKRLILIEILREFETEIDYSTLDKNNIAASAKISKSATILPGAIIMDNVEIGDNVVIYPNAVIEPNAIIKKNTIIHACCVIGYNCQIGENCILYANTTIGADGFGYYDHTDGSRHKVPQIGNVIIKDFVEIGASSTIDRATIESTIIGKHTKIDNQVQLGHNCQVGEYVYIAGSTGISGSVIIKDKAIIAGLVGVGDHVTIGEKALVMGMTGVPNNLKEKGIYFGIPARPIKESHKINGALPHLPELLKRVKALES